MACCGDFDRRSKFSGGTDRKKRKKNSKNPEKLQNAYFASFYLIKNIFIGNCQKKQQIS